MFTTQTGETVRDMLRADLSRPNAVTRSSFTGLHPQSVAVINIINTWRSGNSGWGSVKDEVKTVIWPPAAQSGLTLFDQPTSGGGGC